MHEIFSFIRHDRQLFFIVFPYNRNIKCVGNAGVCVRLYLGAVEAVVHDNYTAKLCVKIKRSIYSSTHSSRYPFQLSTSHLLLRTDSFVSFCICEKCIHTRHTCINESDCPKYFIETRNLINVNYTLTHIPS